MSIKTNIEYYTGDIDSPSYTAQAQQFVNDGIRFVYGAVLLNGEMASRLSNETEVTTSTGISLTDTMSIDYVQRLDASSNGVKRECIEGEAALSGLYDDEKSMYYATKTSPVYYIKDNNLVIHPECSSTEKGFVGTVKPDLVSNIENSYSTESTRLLPELRAAVTLYASAQILLSKMNAIGKPTDANLTTITAGDVNSDADRRDVNMWLDIVGDYIKDEDVELASAYLSKINSYLQNYQMELTADQSQYQWYESQYLKVSQSLASFLQPYIGFGGAE